MANAESDYRLPPESRAAAVRTASLEQVERRNRVIRLRRAGATYEQISMALARDPEEPMSITADGCRKIVTNYLDRLQTEDAESVEQIRTMENERLDEMQSGL